MSEAKRSRGWGWLVQVAACTLLGAGAGYVGATILTIFIWLEWHGGAYEVQSGGDLSLHEFR